MKTIPVEQAVGMVLPHDVTEIRPGDFKGVAFKKGHIIQTTDVEHLKRLGKENIYVLELKENDIHENEAAKILAIALGGEGVKISGDPVEGKLNLLADRTGLLKVEIDGLYHFNLLGEVMCATLHSNNVVKTDDLLAATRLIPLIGKRELVEKAAAIARETSGIVKVLPIRRAKAGLVITGNEVYHGRIKDGFEPILRKKIAALDSTVVRVAFAPDEPDFIAAEIGKCLDVGADLIITSGGMSVDPDDVTRQGIRLAGASSMVYGTPVLPGAMFMVADLNGVPILGLPACGMFNKITIFDLVLPRILAGETIGRTELAQMGYGGLCRQCEVCTFPICAFGKGD